MLVFIPAFDDPSIATDWQIPMDEDHWPDVEFMKGVSRFMDVCYKNGVVVRFDWENWETEAMKWVREPALLKEADLGTVRRLLTWHIRQNRFTKNHVATMIASGHIRLILKRLQEL